MDAINIFLAFVEGLALIASPCILPVLPLMLSASLDGGRSRPFGVIVGFTVSFSAFVLLSRQLVGALHIEPDAIRTGSLALLGGFGLIMLSGTLSARFSAMTQSAANIGNRLSTTRHNGFGGGVVIGALIGLVWTPCAGPILAAVLVQVIRQQTDFQGVLVTLAFTFGASVPMLLIALAGRRLIARLRFLNQHTEVLRKVFGILILMAVALMELGAQAQTAVGMPTAATTQSRLTLRDGLAKPYPAPELRGIAAWLNSPPLALADLKGKVVLVDFWTYSCVNCVRTLPYITRWDRAYRDKGLVVIGVHAPEFEFEKNIDNVRAALARYGIAYPVALDNSLATWLSFDNRYWPAHYLIDRNGQVVYTHFGEGKYDVTENNIRYLLGLGAATEDAVPAAAPLRAKAQTPETYLGFARAERFDGASPLRRDDAGDYRPAASLPEHHWTLGGAWHVESERIVSRKAGDLLRLHFNARKVFLVMGTADGAARNVTVQLNGAAPGASAGKDVKDAALAVNGHALYELINQPTAQEGLLTVTAQEAGIELYAFTFGN